MGGQGSAEGEDNGMGLEMGTKNGQWAVGSGQWAAGGRWRVVEPRSLLWKTDREVDSESAISLASAVYIAH